MRHRRYSPVRGFTLIELLIVVGIIAILAAIAVPNFLEAQVRAKVSRVRSDLRAVATALESYAVSYNKYPPMLGPDDGAGQPENQNNGYGNPRRYHSAWRCVPHQITTPVAYMASIPQDVFKHGAVSDWPADTANMGKPYANGNPFDMSFVYHNIAQFAETGGLYPFDGGDIDDYGQWRIYSIGPDRSLNSIGTGDPTMGWLYDPTNGTISSGEIIRTQTDPNGVRFNPQRP